MQDFYIAREGQAYGPVTLDETNRMVLEGKIDLTTLIWDQRSGTWTLASEHPIVARIFQRHIPNSTPEEKAAAAAAPAIVVAMPSENDVEAQKLSSDLAELRTKFTAMRSEFDLENERIAKELAARRAEKDKLEKEIAARASEKKKIDAELVASAESRAQAEALAKDIAAKREELLGVEKLVAESRSLGEELARVSEQVAARRGELSLVNTDIESSIVERDALAEKLAEERRIAEEAAAAAAAKNRELADSARAFQNQIITLDEETASRRTKSDELAAGIEARSAEFAALESTLGGIRRDIATSETRARAINEELTALERRREEIARLKSEHESAEKDLGATRTELEKLRMQRNAHDAEIKLVSDRLSMIRAETADLEEKRLLAQAMLGEQVSNAFDNIKTTLADMRSLTEVWTGARESDDAARREGLTAITEITERLKRREEDLLGLVATLGEQVRSDGERALAEAAAADARTRVDEIRNELKSITVLCYEESERLAEYRSEREDVRSNIVAEESRLFELLAEKTRLASEVAETSGRMATYSIDLRSLQCEVDALKRERGVHEGAIEELRRLRGNVLDSYLQVESDLAGFTGQATAAQARIAELEQQGLSLEEAIAGRRSELEALVIEREKLAVAAKAQREENDAIERSAAEARHEVEAALESALRELSEAKAQVDRARAEADDVSAQKIEAIRNLAGLKEEIVIVGERNRLMASERDAAQSRLESLQALIVEKETLLGRLRESEVELTSRRARLDAERIEQEKQRDAFERAAIAARDRLGVLESELVNLERERVMRGAADLNDLRELLRGREARERENLDKLLADARVEFQQLREDWSTEERAGVTNDELRKLRADVEEKRREMTKMERQLAAMRAGLAKLREENGRTLLQRVQSFEQQQLEDLRRRLSEARLEQESLDREWGKEMKSGELVDRQWFEIKDAEKTQ